MENAEEWHTYMVDYVTRILLSLDGTKWNIIERYAPEEAQAMINERTISGACLRKYRDSPVPNGQFSLTLSTQYGLLDSSIST